MSVVAWLAALAVVPGAPPTSPPLTPPVSLTNATIVTAPDLSVQERTAVRVLVEEVESIPG